jgi:hypothetical protein
MKSVLVKDYQTPGNRGLSLDLQMMIKDSLKETQSIRKSLDQMTKFIPRFINQ